ncbi:hypothetical protein [Streptomyces mirabilis]|nr:hypothetical protein [Streptomyces mirabilis]
MDQALVDRGVPPGTVRLNLGARPAERMRIRLSARFSALLLDL